MPTLSASAESSLAKGIDNLADDAAVSLGKGAIRLVLRIEMGIYLVMLAWAILTIYFVCRARHRFHDQPHQLTQRIKDCFHSALWLVLVAIATPIAFSAYFEITGTQRQPDRMTLIFNLACKCSSAVATFFALWVCGRKLQEYMNTLQEEDNGLGRYESVDAAK